MPSTVKIDGSRLREYRKRLGTQEYVANEVGMSRSYLAELELGKKNPTSWTVERLAFALNITPRDLTA